jgi:hypothetical protein
MIGDTDDNKKRMLKALEQTWGIVSPACAAVGISRQTHYRWLEEDAEYKAAALECKNVGKDNAEHALVKLCEGATYEVLDMEGNIVTLRDKPNASAVIFANKTLNKDRGYIEKQEIDTTIQPVQINVGITSTDSDDNQDS